MIRLRLTLDAQGDLALKDGNATAAVKANLQKVLGPVVALSGTKVELARGLEKVAIDEDLVAKFGSFVICLCMARQACHLQKKGHADASPEPDLEGGDCFGRGGALDDQVGPGRPPFCCELHAHFTCRLFKSDAPPTKELASVRLGGVAGCSPERKMAQGRSSVVRCCGRTQEGMDAVIRMPKELLIIVTASLLCAPLQGAEVTSLSSNAVGNNDILIIRGSGLGVKSPVAPWLYDDFESGANGAAVSGNAPEVGSVRWTHYTRAEQYYDAARSFNGGKAMYYDDTAANSTTVALAVFGQASQTRYVSWRFYRVLISGSAGGVWKLDRTTSALGNGSANPPYDDCPNFGWGNTQKPYYNNCANFLDGTPVWPPNDLRNGAWNRIEHWQTMSTVDVANGEWAFWLNLVPQFDSHLMTCTSAALNGCQIDTWMSPGFVNDQGHWEWWVDCVYIDNTRRRVEIGNNASWASCTERVIQIPQNTWNDGQIEVKVKTGPLAGSAAYLFVVDDSGQVLDLNGAAAGEGYPITMSPAGGCTPADTRSCYSGAPGTSGVGLCKAGTQTCVGGSWGACVGAVTPVAESCNGKDDDCDGTVDELWPSLRSACTAGLGACARSGHVVCTSNGAGTECDAHPGTPGVEDCEGSLDEDCDGNVDNGCPCRNGESRDCYSGPSGTEGIGLCHAGTQSCDHGTLTACDGEVVPTAEICGDGEDNDCDSLVDVSDPDCGCAEGDCSPDDCDGMVDGSDPERCTTAADDHAALGVGCSCRASGGGGSWFCGGVIGLLAGVLLLRRQRRSASASPQARP